MKNIVRAVTVATSFTLGIACALDQRTLNPEERLHGIAQTADKIANKKPGFNITDERLNEIIRTLEEFNKEANITGINQYYSEIPQDIDRLRALTAGIFLASELWPKRSLPAHIDQTRIEILDEDIRQLMLQSNIAAFYKNKQLLQKFFDLRQNIRCQMKCSLKYSPRSEKAF